jgi:Arc/MetJ-type ribon-helix-helix transcriptional regulator
LLETLIFPAKRPSSANERLKKQTVGSLSLVPGAEDDAVNIGIPHRMYDEIERKIRGTRFGSVQDYVRAVLEEAISEEAGRGSGRGLSAEDEAQIKEKLKALGYI